MKIKMLAVLGVAAVAVGLGLTDGAAQSSQAPQTPPSPTPSSETQPSGVRSSTSPARSQPQPSPAAQPPAPAASPTPGPTGTGASAQSGLTIASDSLLGSSVRDAQGKDVGEVSKILIDPRDGKVNAVIIKRGGTLGMGGEEISVPWSALQVQRDENRRLVITMRESLLEPTQKAREEEQPRRTDQPPAASPATGGQPQGGQTPPRQ